MQVVVRNLFPREDREPLKAKLQAALTAIGIRAPEISFTDPEGSGEVSPLVYAEVMSSDFFKFNAEVQAVIERTLTEAKHVYHLVREVTAPPEKVQGGENVAYEGVTG